jgi:uncharacterized integral membrane protein
MQDDPSKLEQRPPRSQPPVPLALAVFASAVVGFMLVVAAIFAGLRYLSGAH